MLETCPDASPRGELRIEREDDLIKIRRILENMDHVESQVMCMRFGLNGTPPKTLKETGRVVGLTRERVRQIEQRALEQIRTAFEPGRLAG